MKIYRKWEPTTLDDIIGQGKAISQVKNVLSRGWGGRSWWITGTSSSGKSTLARILAREGASELAISNVVGRQLTPNYLAELKQTWAYVPFGKGGYALIVDEAHGMTKPVVEIMLSFLEELKDSAVVIFTTTNDGNDLFEDHQMDASPFASRCIHIKLTSQGLKAAFAERLAQIAVEERLAAKKDAELTDRCQRMLAQNKNNLRRCIIEIEKGVLL